MKKLFNFSKLVTTCFILLLAMVTIVGCDNESTEEPTVEQPTDKPTVEQPTDTPTVEQPTDKPTADKTNLSTPNVSVDDELKNKVVWTADEKASSYMVYINDDTKGIEVEDAYYYVPLADTAISYTVKVQALVSSEYEATHLDSAVSNAVTVVFEGAKYNEWYPEDIQDEWYYENGSIVVINEGVDLTQGKNIALVKQISEENKYLNVYLRDFEGQESGDTGAKVKLTVNGELVKPINFTTDVVELDKDCGRTVLATYDLSKYISDEEAVIRFTETTGYSTHCVISYVELLDLTNVIDSTTHNLYWGHDYLTNWDGEMTPAEGLEKPAIIANDETWIKVGATDDINEGLKLQKESSVLKYIKVTEENSLMTLAVRNFGSPNEEYAGGVSVNGVFLNAIGDKTNYFTKQSSATYLTEGVGDGGQVATMKTYDLSAYIGETVCLAIVNLKCYSMGGNEDLVIGSVSFTKALEVSENLTLNGEQMKALSNNLPFMPAGPSTIYNEGISFRVQDFAGGVSQQFDLTNVASDKKVYVKTYWRSVVDDNIEGQVFQKLVNGALVDTKTGYLLRDKEDNLTCIGFDVTEYVGEKVFLGVHIPSRTYRAVLTKLEIIVSDTIVEDLDYSATKDEKPVVESNGEFSWGHDYTSNWGGEMGDSGLKYPTLLSAGWVGTGDVNDGFGEGCKIGYGAYISKTFTVTEKHVTMALTARTFGSSNFKGAVAVKVGDAAPVALKAIGYNTDYFTLNDAYTKLNETENECQNAPMYVYDLSAYLGQEVTIIITNAAVADEGFDDRLVIGSVGFTSVLEVTESLTWNASTVKENGNINALEVLPCGPFSIYNEGINFRTQDFASGVTRTLDLSNEALVGKNVKVRLGFRNFNAGGESIVFQLLLNGALVDTVNKTINEDITYLEFDLTQLIGQSNVNLGVHIPSRTYRICLTGLEIIVE